MLNAEIGRSLQLPDFKKRLMEQEGADVVSGTPADFGEFIRSELKKYAEIVRISGARVD